MSIDSIYAMLAKPVIAKVKAKRKVKQVSASAAATNDNPDLQNTALAEHLERRGAKKDRRQQQDSASPLPPHLERRKAPETDRRKRQQATASEEPETVTPESTHTRIDINV
ncbi:hypothetical protein [Shewanella fidelis]|uniref:hypothetical protein n=1 Tax=Shewanella fidelis TaxID=173509 RepID=UPI0004B5A634|nr:hypothetical protein [Shewanella fidelis]